MEGAASTVMRTPFPTSAPYGGVTVLRTPMPESAAVTVLRTPIPAVAVSGEKRRRDEGDTAEVLSLLRIIRNDVAALGERVSRVESGGISSTIAARKALSAPPTRITQEQVMKLIDHACLQVGVRIPGFSASVLEIHEHACVEGAAPAHPG